MKTVSINVITGEQTITERELTPEEILAQEAAIAKAETDRKVQEYKAYLNSTDFYYARKAETGEEVPADVVTKRLEAREFIRLNEGV